MMKINNTAVTGIEAAVRGMRNPLKSWDKGDSKGEKIGDKDMALALRLAVAGPEHGKFLRMIHVSCDITAPVYWWAEMDTYKVGTTRDSCSFMHTGCKKIFSFDDVDLLPDDTKENEEMIKRIETKYGINFGDIDKVATETLSNINDILSVYWAIEESDEKEFFFFLLRKYMPCGYLYQSTWDANYAVLRTIYHQRKNHRLPEWHMFCKWIETLPYSELITED